MILNMTQLKELMEPLVLLCKKEKTVNIAGYSVVLRHLTPIEETEVQKMLPDIDEKEVSAVEYADSFRKEVLCRSIVEFNGQSLRDLEFLETGENLPNGSKVKIKREEAVLQIIETWSRPVISKLFEQYGVLSEEIELEMDDSLKLNLEDKDIKQANLKERINNLDQAQMLDEVSNEQEIS